MPTGKKMTYEDMLQLAPPLEREKLIKDMLIYGTAIFDRDKKKRIDPAGKKIEKPKEIKERR
jgi:hypothetical protein